MSNKKRKSVIFFIRGGGLNTLLAAGLLILSVALLLTACLSNRTATDINNDLERFNVTLYSQKEQIPLDKPLTLEGEQYDSAQLQGKYVFVSFWATWCPYCQREMPSKQRLYDEIAEGWFDFLSIAVGQEPETVLKYMKENGFDQPVVFDLENELKDVYAPRIPTSYILDTEGNIVARINGSQEWDSARALRVLNYLIPRNY